MIVQNQPDGSLIMISQSDHSRVSGVFAAHWGNASFERPEPYESVVRAAMLHDCGWYRYEASPRFDDASGTTPTFMQVALDAEQLGAFQWGSDWVADIDPYAGMLVNHIAAFSTGPVIEPLTSLRKVKYKISDFTAVGALEKDVSVCVTWHASPIKTLADAKAREVTLAGTGLSSPTDMFPLALNAVLGTKFRVVSGYVGTQETLIAIERGETEGRCGWGFSSMKSSKPDWLRDKRLNILVQLGFEKHPEASDAPSALDLISDEADRQFMRVLVAPQSINRPYLAPPDLPADRAKEIRAAFMAAMKDETLKAEFTKMVGEEPAPTSGEDMQKLLNEIDATPPAVVARLKAVLNPGK